MSKQPTLPRLNPISIEKVLKELTDFYGGFNQVRSVVLSGSLANEKFDTYSDLDVYVYTDRPIQESARLQFTELRSENSEIGNTTWELTDEWNESDTGIHIDVMYRSPDWAEAVLNEVAVDHRASLGYTTCIWHNVMSSIVLYDRRQWFSNLQARVNIPYPRRLAQNIISKNLPLLIDTASNFTHQAIVAAKRNDHIAIQHRCTAFFASYFDVLFAANSVLHPGEKRVLQYAEQLPHKPKNLTSKVSRLLSSQVTDSAYLESALRALANELKEITYDANFTAHQ